MNVISWVSQNWILESLLKWTHSVQETKPHLLACGSRTAPPGQALRQGLRHPGWRDSLQFWQYFFIWVRLQRGILHALFEKPVNPSLYVVTWLGDLSTYFSRRDQPEGGTREQVQTAPRGCHLSPGYRNLKPSLHHISFPLLVSVCVSQHALSLLYYGLSFTQ